ncbi:MAG: hypothetical protein ACR2IV_14630 [Bryobacteraceae bacterium]
MASRGQWWRVVIGLVIFGVAFGYVEAAVVSYLRSMYAPLRAHLYPTVSPGELFPLLTLDQLSAFGSEHTTRLKIELGRELATLAMLASVGLIAARRAREWIAAFVVCFGIWDIAFYLSLKLLLDWPASLFTWDILFLLPVPWVGPVIAPVLVSISMITAGLVVLWREYNDRPVYIARSRWAVIILGGAIVVTAFIWDFRNTGMGRSPNPFNWILFLVGELAGVFAFASAIRSP